MSAMDEPPTPALEHLTLQIVPGKVLQVNPKDVLEVLRVINVPGFTLELAVKCMSTVAKEDEMQHQWVKLGEELKEAFGNDKVKFKAHDDDIQNLIKLALPQRKRDLLSGAIAVPPKVKGVEDSHLNAKNREDRRKAQSFVANTWARVVKYAFPPAPFLGTSADRKRKGAFRHASPLSPLPCLTRPPSPPPSPFLHALPPLQLTGSPRRWSSWPRAAAAAAPMMMTLPARAVPPTPSAACPWSLASLAARRRTRRKTLPLPWVAPRLAVLLVALLLLAVPLRLPPARPPSRSWQSCT